MENILTKIILSLSAVFASLGALFSQVPPEAITPVDPITQIVIESPKENEPIPENNPPPPSPKHSVNPVPTTPTPRPDPIQTAYEIGKAQGYVQGVADTIKETKPKEELPIDKENDMPIEKETKTALDRINKRVDALENKAPEPVVAPVPIPVRKIKINAEELGVKKPKTFDTVKVGEEFAIRVEILEDEKPLKNEIFTISVDGKGIFQDRTLSTNYTIGQSDTIWYSIVSYTAEKKGKHTVEVKSGDIISSIEIIAE